MTDILAVLPDFDARPHAHILPSLERHLLSTADLLTLDAADVARRARLPPADVARLAAALLAALHRPLPRPPRHVANGNDNDDGRGGEDGNGDADDDDGRDGGLRTGHSLVRRWACIGTLDDRLDALLGGGVASGFVTEIVGESAVGKTQLLLTLLLSVQLPSPHRGRGRSALYISTEGPLQTTRLTQILRTHPRLSSLPVDDRPSLSRVRSTHVHDVEAQDHILRYHVPVAVRQHDIGLLVIDSVAANYRAEFDRAGSRNVAESFAKRSAQVARLGALLRHLARTHDIAVVLANQVADRFSTVDSAPGASLSNSASQASSYAATPPPPPSQPVLQPSFSTWEPLSLDHQQRFFTGWGDDEDDPSAANLKTPSLGLAWTNQLAARIALLKQPLYGALPPAGSGGEERDIVGWKRTVKVVFSAWCAEGRVGMEIWEGGVRSVDEETIENVK